MVSHHGLYVAWCWWSNEILWLHWKKSPEPDNNWDRIFIHLNKSIPPGDLLIEWLNKEYSSFGQLNNIIFFNRFDGDHFNVNGKSLLNGSRLKHLLNGPVCGYNLVRAWAGDLLVYIDNDITIRNLHRRNANGSEKEYTKQMWGSPFDDSDWFWRFQ